MNTGADNVLLSFAEVVEHFRVSAGAVRAWVAARRLVPVRREGRGRGGRMLFARGEVAVLVYGVCANCGNGFKRDVVGAEFCSRLCRDRHRRLRSGKGSPPVATPSAS